MSYFIRYEVECDECGKRITTDFGIVGGVQTATPVTVCECGGHFKRIDNYLEG